MDYEHNSPMPRSRLSLLEACSYIVLFSFIVGKSDYSLNNMFSVLRFMKESVYDRCDPLQAKLSITVGGENQQSVKEFLSSNMRQ